MARRSGTIFVGDRAPNLEGRVPDSVASANPLRELLDQSEEPLYVLSTVFPFVIFTDKLIIRANHVDVITGVFFGSATSTRLLITDIRQVELQFNPIFATLEIIPLGPLEQMMRVKFLWKDQAKKARRILSGLMESVRKNIDLSGYTRAELVSAMEEVGTARE